MSQTYPTISIHPHGLQFVAGNMGGITLTVAVLTIAGCDGLVPKSLFPFLMILFLVMLINLSCRYVYLRRMLFCINEEQVRYEYGIFSLQRDYIELYRVVDYSEQRSFAQMLFGLKTVSIYSGDKTSPRLDVVGVRNHIDLITIIRERVEYNKKKRNIHEFTNIR